MKYKKVSIIGVGLIGGSVGIDLLKKGLAGEVAGWGRNRERLEKAIEKGACSTVGTSIMETLKGSDIVLLCTPVEMIAKQIKEIGPFVKEDTLLMDVGSVKENIVNAASDAGLIGAEKEFVGAHPMTGSEKSGVINAQEGLFRGAPCIITPHENNSNSAVERAAQFWKELEANVIQMTPGQHDLTVGFVSHLPHVVSTILSKVCANSLDNPDSAERAAGPSFRDLTRIAGASPQLWSQIYLQNRKQVLKAVNEFSNSLEDFKKIVGKRNREKLEKFITEGRPCRKEINQGESEKFPKN